MCGVAFVEEREESNKPVILLICYVGVRFGLKYKKKGVYEQALCCGLWDEFIRPQLSL